MNDAINLRPYQAADEDAAIDLWLRSWQAAYPALDFASRLDWWRSQVPLVALASTLLTIHLVALVSATRSLSGRILGEDPL